MKKLRRAIYSVCITFVCMTTTAAVSGPIELTGILKTIQKKTSAIQFQGSYSDDQSLIKGVGKKDTSSPEFEIGINIPIGQTFQLGIGGVKNINSSQLSKILEVENFSDLITTIIDRKSWDVKPKVKFLGNTIRYNKDTLKIITKSGVTLETSTKKSFGNISVSYKF